jgi:hypothetical protein
MLLMEASQMMEKNVDRSIMGGGGAFGCMTDGWQFVFEKRGGGFTPIEQLVEDVLVPKTTLANSRLLMLRSQEGPILNVRRKEGLAREQGQYWGQAKCYPCLVCLHPLRQCHPGD